MLVKKHYKKIIISLFIGLLVFGFLGFFNLSALQAQELDLGVEEVGEATGLSQGGGDLRVTIGRIIQAFLGFLGVIALAIVLYGGFLYMTAGGSQDKIDKAKKLLINAFIGLTIILASYAITSFVISRLTEAIGTGVEVSTGGDGYGPDGCQGGLCTSGGSSFIVKSISPTGDTDIRNVKVKINFSKAVNPASVNQENIQISKAGGNQFETQNLIPVLAEENNDNSTEILVAVSEDDDNFGGENGWLVCSEDYLGDTPMKLGYDLNTIDFTDIEEVKFVFESEISSEQSIFDVYCGDDIEEEVEQLKQAWLPNNGFNEIILPEACYSESNNVHIKFVRQGEGCLKMDQAILQVQTKSQASDQENLVAGTLSVDSENGKAVVFSPEASCPEPNQDLACFEADSTYEVNIKAGGVKTLAGGFNGVSCAVGSQCSGQFTTGNLVDTAAPEVNISAPYDGQKLSINSNIFVDVSASDDSAVAGSKLYIDDEFYNEHLSNDVSQEYLHSYTWMAWLEQGYDLGQHNIKVQAMDIDDNTVEEDIDVYLLPEDCFDENGDIICGSPECGACDGDFCSSDAECAGECLFTCGGTGTTSCENDDDCDGEEACLGVCSSLPIISDIAPKKAGPGNLVSIVGFGFEAFQENDQPENNLVASRVYFTSGFDENNQPVYLQAELGCDPAGSWSDNQIVAKVPSEAVTGPVKIINKLNQTDNTQNDRGWVGDFEVDEGVSYPGLCSVQRIGCAENCQQGFAKDEIEAEGENFGETENENDGLFFAQSKVLNTNNPEWRDNLISGRKVPLIDPGRYNVAVKKGAKISNPMKFTVISSEFSPTVESVEPGSAPIGALLTIKGNYFGDDIGHVGFVRTMGDGNEYEWVGEFSCGEQSWSNQEVIIKVPESIANTAGELGESVVGSYQLVVYTADGLASNYYNFEINDNQPGPGLCSLSPDNGPVGTTVEFIGENFSSEGDYNILFNAGEDGSTVQVVEFDTWENEKISGVKVPEGALSGKVYLEAKTEDGLDSNKLIFSVGSCSEGSCAEGLTCCDDGVCRASCEEEIVSYDSEYMWLMSTGPLPKIPQVVERKCEVGVYPQSPSPWLGSEEACPNGLISATFNMLMKKDSFNNNIIIKRCLTTDGTKCDFNDCGDDCVQYALNNVPATDFAQTNLNADSTDPLTVFYLNQVFWPTNDGQNEYIAPADNSSQGLVELKEVGQSGESRPRLFTDTWYQIIIKGGDQGVTSQPEDPFEPQPLGEDYVWEFKTKSEPCMAEDLLLSPVQGLIESLEDTQSYLITGQYECQSLAMDDKVWNWGVDTEYQDKIKNQGVGCISPAGTMCPVPETPDLTNLRYDIGYFGLKLNENNGSWSGEEFTPSVQFETLDNPAVVRADADFAGQQGSVETLESLYKEAYLNVVFADPKINNYFPDCDTACINSAVGVDFNVKMKKAQAEDSAYFKMYQCQTADCTYSGMQEIILPGGLNYTYVSGTGSERQSRLMMAIDNADNVLEQNTYYRVVISGDLQSASNKNLTGLNYSSDPSVGGNCRDRQDNDGDGFIDYTGGYVLSDSSALDYVCGCFNETEERFTSFEPINSDYFCPQETDVLACLDLGSYEVKEAENDNLIKQADDLLNIKDNARYYQADKMCQTSVSFESAESSLYDAFSWVFKTENTPDLCQLDRVEVLPVEYLSQNRGEQIKYVASGYAEPDECSDEGQLLSPYLYDWSWQSSEPLVADVSQSSYTGEVPDFCDSKTCLVQGSREVTAVCGDGEIYENMEECDDGNTDDGDGCNSQCLTEPIDNCSYQSLVNETATGCCGDGVINGNEECDFGCEYKDAQGNPCDPEVEGADCVCRSNSSACTNGCLNAGTAEGFVCGNGIVEAGEDVDLGEDNSLYDITDNCLRSGAKFQDGDPEVAAMCGNGTVENGEECEPIPFTVQIYNCDDGIDNDGDGLIDFEYYESRLLVESSMLTDGVTELTDTVVKEEDNSPIGDYYIKIGPYSVNPVTGTEKVKFRVCSRSPEEDSCQGEIKDIDVYSLEEEEKYKDSENYFTEYKYDNNSGEEITLKVKFKLVDNDGQEDRVYKVYYLEDFSDPECSSANDNELSEEETKTLQLCKDNCTWMGFPACDQDNPASCCGNGQVEVYDDAGAVEEECEAVCQDKNTGEACDYGEQDCQCLFPEGCSTRCLNMGSKAEYGSICGDGVVGIGEDEDCEPATASPSKGSPVQIVTVTSALEDCLNSDGPFFFDAVGGYTTGSTDIIANTTENITGQEVSGQGTLEFRDPGLCQADFETVAIDNEASFPSANEDDVCRNPLLYIKLNQTLTNTSEIKAELIQQNCEPEEDESVAFWQKPFNFLKRAVTELFRPSSLAAEECQVDISASFRNPENDTTIIELVPGQVLQPGESYEVKLENLYNNCLESVGPLSYEFTTGGEICLLDKVDLRPQDLTIMEANHQEVFTAYPKSGTQPIIEVEDIYEWRWKWEAKDTTIVDSVEPCSFDDHGDCLLAEEGSGNQDPVNTDLENVKVTTLAKNGKTVLEAEAQIVTDQLSEAYPEIASEHVSTYGAKTSGLAQITVFICENIWTPFDETTDNWQVEKFTSDTGDEIPTYIHEASYNMGLLYCRDKGEPDNTEDDLPGLSVVKEVPFEPEPETPECSDGQDNDDDGLIDYKPSVQAVVPNQTIGDWTFNNVTFWQSLTYNSDQEIIIYRYGPTSDNSTALSLSSGEVGTVDFSDINNGIIDVDKVEITYLSDSDEIDFRLYNSSADPDCDSPDDISESPDEEEIEEIKAELLQQYFLVRGEDDGSDDSSDVISIRIYSNPEFLSPDMWYQKYAPNPAGSTEEVNVDCQEDMEGNEYCYLAAKDNTSVYVAAANLAEFSGQTTADIYNNIYLIGYNQGSNQNTLNIFSQLINNLKFNYNIDNSQLNKSEMIRDYVRIQDNVRIRKYIKQYGYEHNGAVPQLQAGTYDRQRTFSVWPSWQEELGVQLGLNMPKDPLNHFKWEQAAVSNDYTGPDCMKPNAVTEDIYHCLDDEYQCIIPMEKCVHCPEGYDSQTCYNSEEKDFFNYYDDNPDEHPVYMYRADPYGLGNTSVYELDFMQEVSDKNYMVTPEFVSYD